MKCGGMCSVEESSESAGSDFKCMSELHLYESLGGQCQCASTVTVSICDLKSTTVDELMIVSDAIAQKQATDSSNLSCKKSGPVTAPALYDSVSAVKAVYLTIATHVGQAAEQGLMKETSIDFCYEHICGSSGVAMLTEVGVLCSYQAFGMALSLTDPLKGDCPVLCLLYLDAGSDMRLATACAFGIRYPHVVQLGILPFELVNHICVDEYTSQELVKAEKVLEENLVRVVEVETGDTMTIVVEDLWDGKEGV